jgi:hypothetical protein
MTLIMPKISEVLGSLPLAESIKPDRRYDGTLCGFRFPCEKHKSPVLKLPALNIQDGSGNDLSHLACSRNRVDGIKFLVAKGLNIDRPNLAGITQLHIAVLLNCYEAAEELIKLGANPNTTFIFSRSSIKSLHGKMISKIVGNHSLLAIAEGQVISAVQIAAITKNKRMLEILLTPDVDFNSQIAGKSLISYILSNHLPGYSKFVQFALKNVFRESYGALYHHLKATPRNEFSNQAKILQAVCIDFSKIKETLVKVQPELLSVLNQLAPKGKIQNGRFAQVVFYACSLVDKLNPETDLAENQHLMQVLLHTFKEQQHLGITWAQYLKKVESNVYKIDGFSDLLTEYQYSVIYPYLINRFVQQGYRLVDLMAKTQIDRTAKQIALTHILDDKSIGSLFRFNTLWHRPDMRLPDAACPGLQHAKWPALIENGYWIYNSRLSVLNLRSGAELTEEGNRMGHCVNSRADQCSKGEAHIFSIRDNSDSIATVDLRINHDDIIQVREFKGYKNTSPPSDAKVVLDKFLEAIKKGDIKLLNERGSSREGPKLFASELAYLRRTYIRPNETPVGALAHYAGLKVYMNQDGSQKFLLGAFRDRGYELARVVDNSVKESLPSIGIGFNQ